MGTPSAKNTATNRPRKIARLKLPKDSSVGDARNSRPAATATVTIAATMSRSLSLRRRLFMTRSNIREAPNGRAAARKVM